MYQHVFFDLDHTIWDFEQNSKNTMFQLYTQFRLADYGIHDFEAFYEVYHAHNERLWTRFRSGFIKREELRWKRMWHTLLDFKIGNTRIANEMSAAYLEILPTQKTLIPNAKSVIETLAKKYPLHIITNGFEMTQKQKLYNCGLSSYFEHIITSEKAHSIKPQIEIFQYAQNLVGASAKECIMIGDALEIDIKGALGAGWDTIYFAPEATDIDLSTTYQVKDLQSVVKLL